MTSRVLSSRWILAVGAALAVSASACDVLAQPPGRPSRPKVVVPEEHARLGTVYHVHAGRDAQVTFTSDAPLEHIKGTTNQVVGYAVAGKPSDSDFALKVAEFQLPVASLDTGIPTRNKHLQEKRWLDAESFPLVVFRLTGTQNPKLEKSAEGFKTYSLELLGSLTIRSSTKTLVVPARITVMPQSEKTKARAPGDLLAIRCEFPVKMSDYGVATGDAAIASGKVSDELALDVFLLLSTAAPDE
ncbi:MAG: YceI family protein [Planctomycetes bacterium]|nr:YceI family protein [Planctomycetota bacterium]